MSKEDGIRSYYENVNLEVNEEYGGAMVIKSVNGTVRLNESEAVLLYSALQTWMSDREGEQ